MSPSYTIAMMGDIMLDRTIGDRFREEPEAFELAEIRRLLEPYDIVFANLENPVAFGGERHPIQDPNVCFRAHPDTLDVLARLGVNVVSLGNNHMLDYGPGALAETLEHLDDRGIRRAGAGRDLEEANRPVEMEVKGRPVAMFSHVFLFSASTERAGRRSAGVSDYRIGPLLRRIREYTARGFDVHVSVHWGIEYQFYPLDYQVGWARRMIDAGATLVIGHGPHYPQGFEDYRDGRIIYSLGNFFFDEPHKFANRSFIYTVEIGRGGVGPGVAHPVHLERGVPRLVHGRPKERIQGLLDALTRRYPVRSRAERRRIDALWFSDLVWRIQSMRSTKFLRLIPLSFFLRLGFKNYLRKLLPQRFKRWVRV